jgi:hypothetical protein
VPCTVAQSEHGQQTVFPAVAQNRYFVDSAGRGAKHILMFFLLCCFFGALLFNVGIEISYAGNKPSVLDEVKAEDIPEAKIFSW